MKTIVENTRDGERTPFLRGILIRSLLDAGLLFEDAYEISSKVRNKIADRKSITTEELQAQVCRLLGKLGQKEIVEQYNSPSVAPPRILVMNEVGVEQAFSRGRNARYMRSTGLKTEKAEYLTELIFAKLIEAGVSSISTLELGYLTYLCLQQEVSQKAARRYLVWSQFQDSKRPLMLLIGGTVASGKSTIATEIAPLLDIVRVQSTDMLREVMRMMIPKRLLPVLHTSSFIAWKALATHDEQDRDFDQLVAEGYRSQAELLAVPCEAVLQRAVQENVPIILEGVHAQPEMLNLTRDDSEVIKVYVMLAVLKSKKLKARLQGRGAVVPQRKPKRYLNNLDSIWSLQSYLLSEADRHDVPIITSVDRDTAVLQITQQVVIELAKQFTDTPRQVFGPVVDRLEQEGEPVPWHEKIVLLRV